MSPDKHILSGFALSSIIYIGTDQVVPAIVGSAVTVFCDLDHVLEYAKYCKTMKKRPSINQFLKGNYFLEKKKMYILFHGYEYFIILVLLSIFSNILSCSGKECIMAAMLGYGLHLFLDLIGNGCPVKMYFLLYRMYSKWDIKNSQKS